MTGMLFLTGARRGQQLTDSCVWCIVQAAAQRAACAGRLRSGHCFRLCTEEAFQQLPQQTVRAQSLSSAWCTMRRLNHCSDTCVRRTVMVLSVTLQPLQPTPLQQRQWRRQRRGGDSMERASSGAAGAHREDSLAIAPPLQGLR